jgi:signal transduction histidine kinase
LNIQKENINLIFDTTVEEKIMTFDSRKLERILLNLLSNSVKFTKPGGSIYVTVYDKKNSVIISVKDTGVGIAKEKQKIIFEKFIQVDKSLSRKHEGSGIGLFLVKSLVEMHKGKFL